jgi:hypothetical protein
MKKFATFLAVGGLAIGLPLSATAVEIVTVQCSIFDTIPPQAVRGSQASKGVTLPVSCAPSASSCSQCVADLLSNRFTLVNSFEPIFGGPYFVFKKGGF